MSALGASAPPLPLLGAKVMWHWCSNRSHRSGVCLTTGLLLVFGPLLILTLPTSEARAQFVCEQNPLGGTGGASATGVNSVACGTGANATGIGTTAIGTAAGVGANAANATNTFIGASAGQAVTGQGNTATGFNAGTNVNGSRNAATGIGAGFNVTGSSNTATGDSAGSGVTGSSNTATGDSAGSFVTGSNNVALGKGAGSGTLGTPLTASNTVSIGNSAVASKDNAIAIGNGATASGTNSTAIGNGASTGTHTDAAAFGNGATVSHDHQQMFGTPSNSYTMAGINTTSTAAQVGPVKLVTADGAGTLGVSSLSGLGLASTGDIAGINSQIASINSELSDHDARIRKATEGVAMAFAMAGVPTVLPGENFAMTANWGNFEGENGFAAGAAMRLGPNFQLNAGTAAGSSGHTFGSRVGARIGW